ncbi:MAG: hypothetical protein ACOX2K_01615 [Bacillota bacterium]
MRPIDLLPSPQERRREELASTLPKLLVWALIVWVMLLTGVYIGFHAQKVELQQTLSSLQEQIVALAACGRAGAADRGTLQRRVDQLQQQFESEHQRKHGSGHGAAGQPDAGMEIVARNLDVDQGRAQLQLQQRRAGTHRPLQAEPAAIGPHLPGGGERHQQCRLHHRRGRFGAHLQLHRLFCLSRG